MTRTIASSSCRRDQRYLRRAIEAMHYKFPEMIDLDFSSLIPVNRSYVIMTRAVHPLLVYIITTGRTGGNNGVVGGLPNRMILYVLCNHEDSKTEMIVFFLWFRFC